MQIQTHAAFPLKKIGLTTDTKQEAALKKACQNFEAIIVQQMLSAMRKSVPKDSLLGGDFSQDIYQSMYDEGLSQEIAAGRGLGLADTLYRQLAGAGDRS